MRLKTCKKNFYFIYIFFILWWKKEQNFEAYFSHKKRVIVKVILKIIKLPFYLKMLTFLRDKNSELWDVRIQSKTKVRILRYKRFLSHKSDSVLWENLRNPR